MNFLPNVPHLSFISVNLKAKTLGWKYKGGGSLLLDVLTLFCFKTIVGTASLLVYIRIYLKPPGLEKRQF